MENQPLFLPMTREEMTNRGWTQADFILISGDAYVDHPSFGMAIIGRVLENFGYKVGIISQPQTDDDYLSLGLPRLAFLITSGNIDSMVNHYSVAKKRRSKDYYTPNGEMGKRPDRATTVYSKKVRHLAPQVPIILGGIEASLRRLSHYDYWSDQVRPSILIESQADLLVYGMGEKPIVAIADALASGLAIQDIIYIRNTVYKTASKDAISFDAMTLPTYQAVKTDKASYVLSFKTQYDHTDPFRGKALIEAYPEAFIIQNPPEFPLSQDELDQVYHLPFARRAHPLLEANGHIPAIDEVKFSIIANRGCYGGCHFCALTMHQGRIMQSRSKASIVEEAIQITQDPDFKGYIHDVGGPTANFYRPACKKQLIRGTCVGKECIGYTPCKNLEVNHSEYLDILRTVRSLPKVKKVFVRSGLRYDYIMYDKDPTFFQELVEHHISGQLKVAPEHVDNRVLVRMGKPSRELYDEFVARYKALNQKFHKNQFLVPYLISSHPG
ncbi:MAG: YgiQ family radical SAM protein, partial [Bacilli bacterium]|nr:YgiQ family radical SAM protein [Bacilli bacterium]